MIDCFEQITELTNRLRDGEQTTLNGQKVTYSNNILRHTNVLSGTQKQTEETFGFKWNKRDTFESGLPAQMRRWLIEKYGDVVQKGWFRDYGDKPIIMDAGCGAALSSLALFQEGLSQIKYIGVDISTAVDVAKSRFEEHGGNAVFLQSDLNSIPLPEESVDLIFSEGVLHHTDNTKEALRSVLRHLKPGGRIIFYVYKKKGPIREFTDDYIREKLQSMPQDEAWDAIMPLTKLGIALGELDIEINVPENVGILGIPAGPITVQRLFYWHVFKAMYRTDITLAEMQHINYDWYAPQNAHRHSIDEVQQWCSEFGLTIELQTVEMAGISIIAKKNQ